MTKKQRESIAYLVSGFTILVGLYIIFKFSLGWQYLLVLLFISAVLNGLTLRFIPNKNQKKKIQTSHKKQTTQKSKTTRKMTGIRSEKELLTLPLSELGWEEFEELCYLYYKAKGMKPIKTKKGADGGVDLIIYSKKDQQKVAVQIKHWTNKVPVKEIRELHSAKRKYNLVLADFISSSGYTTEALKEADRCNIKAETAFKIEKWRKQKTKKKLYV